MASVTRSTRRAEGLPPRHVNGEVAPHARASSGGFQHARRPKRAPAAIEHDFNQANPNPKKTRIAVEILAKPPPSKPHTATVRPTTAATTPINEPIENSKATISSDEQDPNVTKHQAKVINGIKHELDRLQPTQEAVTKEQGRKLRSQEATRFKSELSAYFPDFDEIIGNEPKEKHALNVETPIVVVDSNPQGVVQVPYHSPRNQSLEVTVRGYGDALYTDVFDTQRIDFGFLEAQYKNKSIEDPLPDSLFVPVHKRAERLERSIRNSEKGRAQHEKDQIIRLLEGLQSHDWLRVMGVSGITETKKKTFEPAREYFIKGCQAILEKFRNWNLEEKRRKLEKERALVEQADDGVSEGSRNTESGRPQGSDEDASENDETARGTHGSTEEDDTRADDDREDIATSQDDASEASSPAKQLRQEAMARSKLAAAKRQSRTALTNPPGTPKEFKSFFNKKYEREGALNRHRRVGRKVLAWGHPVPDVPETDFDLPEGYRDNETMKARARKKRRDKRGNKA